MARVLVAADAEWLHNEIRSVLGGSDTTVDSVYSGAEVRDEVAADPPDLVILDLQIGTMGGMLASILFNGQASSVYIASAKQAVTYNEILGGLIKPTVFGFIIAIIGCYKGLSTTGGTVGVGRSTTQSVVVTSILIIAVDFLLMKLILSMLLAP